MDGHCRLGVKCAYKHNLIKDSNHEDTNEDIRNIKAELDVLKNTIKFLISIKEEGRILQKDVVLLKEEIKFLIAANKDITDKICELHDDYVYDTEEEVETEIFEDKNGFDDFEELFQIESVEGELTYACNVCDEGFDTEDEIKKHLNTHHKEILQSIGKDSDVIFKNPNQKEKVFDEQKRGVEKTKVKVLSKEPYTCKECVVLGIAKFVSSDHKEINDHIFHHFEISRQEKEAKDKKKKEEQSLDDEDLYEGFDEDGNRIA